MNQRSLIFYQRRKISRIFLYAVLSILSLFSVLTFPLVRFAGEFKGKVRVGQVDFMLLAGLEAAPLPTAAASKTEGFYRSTALRGFSLTKGVCLMSSSEDGFEKSFNLLL